MKRLLFIWCGVAFILAAVFTVNNLQAQLAGFAVTERGADWRVLSRSTVENGTNRVHQITELATGLNYQNSYGQWVESKEQIDILPAGGAAAVQGQHKVYFPGDICNGVIEVVTPAGQHLKSRPLGMSYDSGSNTVLIAVLTNSIGQLVGSNQVIYPDAFVGLEADLRYTYTRTGLEQDVILRRQPPAPGRFGLDAGSTKLQLLTEFFNTPDPTNTATTTSRKDGLQDATLRFGGMKLARGRAFSSGDANQKHPSVRGTPVYKSWVHVGTRKFLVEQVPYPRMAVEMQTLPLTASATLPGNPSHSTRPKASLAAVLPPAHEPVSETTRMQIAATDFNRQPGMVLDYVELDSGTMDDYTFYADTTYFISGPVAFGGNVTFEGGTVIKYPNDTTAYIEIDSSVACPATTGRPAIFTAADDDSMGESMNGVWGGYSGTVSGYYANPAIAFNIPYQLVAPQPLTNVYIAYARQGISSPDSWLGSSYGHLIINDSQIINCYDAIVFSDPNEAEVVLNNCLIANVNSVFLSYDDDGSEDDWYVNQSTIDNCVQVVENPVANAAAVFYATNSIFSNVGNWVVIYETVYYASGSSFNNGYYNTPGTLPGDTGYSSTDYPYQTAAAANYYLTNGSPYRNVGTSDIDYDLLTEIQTMTTYAPPDGGWPDTNAPDLGYHYPVNEDSDFDSLPDWWEWKNFGNYSQNSAGDYDGDGFSNLQEYQNGTDPADPDSTPGLLGRWHFDTTNWLGAQGRQPLAATNLNLVSSWSSNAMELNTEDGDLRYKLVEEDGHTNLNLQCGTIRFWFRPNWSSVLEGGIGGNAENWPTLFEAEAADSSGGFWGAYIDPNGTQLSFDSTDGTDWSQTLEHSIFWKSNQWHQVAITYTVTNSALYVDGALVASASGISVLPPAVLNEFYVGNDVYVLPAFGSFDELDTFDYPLTATRLAADYQATINRDSDGNGLPDFWELNNFGHLGVDPNADPDADGYSNLQEQLMGTDPNGFTANNINFYISVPSQYINTNHINAGVTVLDGTPFYYAVLVDSTDFPNATWTAYTSSNIAVNFGSTEGKYSVWVGLRGLPSAAPQTWQEMTFMLDKTPPEILVTNPMSGTVSQPFIQVQGLANEELGSLTFDVSNAVGVITNQTGYISDQFYDTNLPAFTTNYFQGYDVTLAGGLNTIMLHAFDLAGNETTTNIAVTLDYSGDTTPPVIQLVWPQNGTKISGSNFAAQAQIDDVTAQVTAKIVDSSGDTNTVQGSVLQDETVWVQNLPLASGTNTVTLIATDAAGNASVTNFSVIQSAVMLTIDPISDDQLNESFVDVTGTVSDTNEIVMVNGIQATVNSDGTWSADAVPANATGSANISAQAYPTGSDPATTPADGGQQSHQLQPPAVAIYSYEYTEAYSDPTTWNSGKTYWVAGQGGFDQAAGPGTTDFWWELLADDPTYTGMTWGESDEYQESDHTGLPYIFSYSIREKWGLETGAGAAGSTRFYLVQALMSDEIGGLPFNWFQIRGQTLMASDETNDDGTVWGETIVTVPAGVTNLDVTPVTSGDALKDEQLIENAVGPYKYIFQEVYFQFDLAAQPVNLQLAVDANRDGNFAPNTTASPYHFWINDSQEHGDDETSGGADDQTPGSSTPNNADSVVNGRSDLVNFFPVALCLSGTLQLLSPANGYEYHLSQADGAINFVYTSLTQNNACGYLTNSGSSTGYGANADEAADAADVILPPSSGVKLDTNWLAQVQASGGTGIILVEGFKATTQPLMLEIWRNGQKLAGVPLSLSISGVEQMFRHLNLSAYGNGSVNVASRASASNEPQTKNANLVFLHGYNVNQRQARGVQSEMFKRFYWSGSKARFYGVTWNGSLSQISFAGFTPNLQTNIVNAFLTAPHLADFLGTLSGETTVTAHSLGNMVVLSAINDYNARINQHFMMDAAMAMEAVQGNMNYEPAMIYSTWQNYSNRLYASDWWRLFSTSDARNTLTWSNRLGNLRSVDVYNFYSSGEEVLRAYPQDPNSTITTTVALELYYRALGIPFGTYCWVWEEKGKGTYDTDGFVGSTHGGWQFNDIFYGTNVATTGGVLYEHMSADAAAQLTASQLQTNSFFDFNSDNNYNTTHPDSALLGIDGSTYAQANRDRILSDAIPALTLPVGANSVSILDERSGGKRNYDMQQEFKTGWPEARSSTEELKWHHSDFDYVAYPFTHSLFDNIVKIGNLK